MLQLHCNTERVMTMVIMIIVLVIIATRIINSHFVIILTLYQIQDVACYYILLFLTLQ